MEMWVSGTGVARDFAEVTGRKITAREIVAEAEKGGAEAEAAMERLEDRLARGLATVVNMLDPDVLVVGGGLSRVERLYAGVRRRLPGYVFGNEADTEIVQARFGDSSGVRGAAWLWPLH